MDLSQNGLNLNLGVSRNRFCDFRANPDSRNFSRVYTLILAGAGTAAAAAVAAAAALVLWPSDLAWP